MTDDSERPGADPPTDPLARAIYDWLDPARREGVAPSKSSEPALRGTDRDRLRHLIDESGILLRSPRFGDTRPQQFLIGPYRTLETLGAGGFAHVHLALDERTGERVALKLLRAELASDPRELERFQREAEAARRVNHPGCVRVLDAGAIDGQPFLALEIVLGDGLDTLIRQHRALGEPLGVERVVRIGIDLCEALEAIHDQGLVHRDVKPANVRLTKDGRVVLVDFGLATGQEFIDLTRTGEFIGSLPYAAPEQVLHGARDVGPRADVYSLAATLYECLTSQTVHAGTSAQQLVLSIARDEPLAPQRLNPRIPRDLTLVLLKALEKSPTLRYASASEFAADLIAVRDQRPVSARPRGLTRSFFAAVRRHPVVAFAATAIVLGGFALPLALFVQQRSYSDELRSERDYAEAQRLAAQSRLEIGSDPGLSALLALESIERANTLDGRNALIAALSQLRECKTIRGPWQRAGSAVALPDERAAIVLSREGDLFRVDLGSGDSTKFSSGFPTQALLCISGDELWVSRSGTQIARFDATSLAERDSITIPGNERSQITALAAAGQRAVVARGKEIVVLEQRAESRRFEPLSGSVRSIALHSAGRQAFAATQSGSLFELDLDTGTTTERLTFAPAERARIALCADGSRIAIETAADVVVLDTAPGGAARHLAIDSPPLSSMALDAAGERLLLARTLSVPQCFEVATGRVSYPLLGHSDQVRSCLFLERSDRILTLGSELDSTVRIYSPQSILDADVIHRVDLNVLNMKCCGDGRSALLYDLDGEFIERIDLVSGKRLWRIGEPGWKTNSVQAFLGREQFLVRRSAEDFEIRSIADGSVLARVPFSETDLPAVDDPTADAFLIGSARGVSRIDALTGQELARFEGTADGPIVNLYRSGNTVLGTTRSSKLLRVDLETRRVSIFAELSPGSFCAMLEFDEHRQRCLTKEADEKTFALTYVTRSLMDGRILDSSPPITSHLFHSFGVTPDGRFAIDSLGSTLYVREIDTGSVRTLSTAGTITACAVRADSRFAVIGSKSGNLRGFALPDLELEFDYEGHSGQVVQAFFDGSSHVLLSASDDGVVRRTDLDTLLSRARNRLPRDWTAAERALFRIPPRR